MNQPRCPQCGDVLEVYRVWLSCRRCARAYRPEQVPATTFCPGCGQARGFRLQRDHEGKVERICLSCGNVLTDDAP